MPVQLVIRDLTLDDYRALKFLLDELGYPSTEAEVKERLNNIIPDKNFKTLLAEVQGKVVGFIGLSKSYAYERNGCYVRIMALVVAREYRNMGIGTQLVAKAEEWAKQNGASLIVLSSGLQPLEAHKFYESKGFRKKGYSFIKKI
jgi:GNAT superfamily N-acetyltransferase